ncbi:unnamed protein product [Prorocentrum cordatum]|uniref:Uncharacterized protein n=1 Tax=Prorocentrum cordatum TaxID=2364126 RepID=A0ABN9VDV7_9DINO|nr:unnamed protein product [Polarella glacialis]
MIHFATLLAALCSVSALQHEEARADAEQQGGLYQRPQQQTLLQQTQQQLQQLQEQQDLLLEQQQQLLQRQRLHRHGQPQLASSRPSTQQRAARLDGQAPGHPQPRRASAPLQMLQQGPAAQSGEEAEQTLPPPAAGAGEPPQLEQAAATVQEPMGMYNLRLCNAYAWPAPVTMSRVQEPKLLEYPLAYKECHEYLLPLREGDELQFRAGDVSIGTFSVRGLPEDGDPHSLLMLIPHRRDEVSAAVAFDSHIFHGGSGAQVAVIDAYRGPEQSTLLIDEPAHEKEDLEDQKSFGSVVAMAPGSYRLSLGGWGLPNARRKAGASAQLHAQEKGSYVVLRVGAARSNLGIEAYPEESSSCSRRRRRAVPSARRAPLRPCCS